MVHFRRSNLDFQVANSDDNGLNEICILRMMDIGLTQRELEILESLASGRSERETYLRLGMSGSDLSEAWEEITVKAQSSSPLSIEEFELLAKVDRVERRRLEAELWASEARLGALMDTAPEAIFVIDGRSGEIVRMNDQAAILFGYSPRELMHKPMELLVPDDVRKKHVGLRTGFLNNIRKREIGYHPLILAQHKDGTLIHLEIGLTATSSTDDVMVVCRSAVAANAEQQSFDQAAG